jgi:phosphoribosyl 1,2-cyclic phosphodiesterase
MPASDNRIDENRPSSGAANAASNSPWESDGLRLHVLATGSAGNASLVETPDGMILVDCGISCRQILARTRALGLDPERIRAILITHDHTDHLAGLRVTASKLHVPVYASAGTLGAARWPAMISGSPLKERISVEIAGVRVTPFPVPHDAVQTFGFRFERAADSIGFCTDIGHMTSEAAEMLSDATVLALEANHDLAMLRSYPGYPRMLKERIAGESGHLSNDQCSAALSELATTRTRCVVGMHISEHTNLPSVCRDALEHGRPSAQGCMPTPGRTPQASGQARAFRVVVASEAHPVSILPYL